jgi:hypothetical protein
MTNHTGTYIQWHDWDEDDNNATVYLSQSLLIRLTDPDKNPLPFARCRIAGDEETIITCDENGIAKIPISDGNQTSIDLEWEPQNAEQTDSENRFYWLNTFQLAVTTINDEECETRLTHLGFYGTLTEQVNTYQTFFSREPTGDINDIRDEMVKWHDGGNYPGQIETDPNQTVSNENHIEYTKITVLLCSPEGHPISQSKWTATVGGNELSGTTENGRIEIKNTDKLPTIKLKWNDQNSQPDLFYEQELFLISDNSPNSLNNRLQNLGYFGITLEDKLLNYRQDFNYSSNVDDLVIHNEIINWHDGKCGMPNDKA